MTINLSVGQLNALANSNPSQISAYSAADWLVWGSRPAYLWQNLTGHVVRLISANKLNAIAEGNNTGAYRTVGRMTTSQFDAWIAYNSIASGFSGERHAFCRLTAHTINVIGSSQHGSPLRATKLTVDLINSWFSTLASPNALSARVFNELALSPNNLLAQLTMGSRTFGEWISHDSTRIVHLSHTTLNALAVTRSVGGSRERPLQASSITADVWKQWMDSNHPPGHAHLFNQLSAGAIDTLAWGGPNGALFGMGSLTPLGDWMRANGEGDSNINPRIESLGVIAVNTIAKLAVTSGFDSSGLPPTWARVWITKWVQRGENMQGVDAALLNFGVAASVPKAADWLNWVSGRAVGGTVDNAVSQLSSWAFQMFSVDIFNAMAPDPRGQNFLKQISSAQFSSWVNFNRSSLPDLDAATLNGLALSVQSILSSSSFSGTWLNAWLKTFASGPRRFAGLTAHTLNALALGSEQPLRASDLNASQFGQWISNNDSPSSHFRLLTATTLNQLVGINRPLEASQITKDLMSEWLTTQVGEPGNSYVNLLSAQVLNALGNNTSGKPLEALTEAHLNAWLGRPNNVARWMELSATARSTLVMQLSRSGFSQLASFGGMADLTDAVIVQWRNSRLQANALDDLGPGALNRLADAGGMEFFATRSDRAAWDNFFWGRICFDGKPVWSRVNGKVLSSLLLSTDRRLTAQEWQEWLNGTPSGGTEGNRGSQLAWNVPSRTLDADLMNQIAADTTFRRNLVSELTAEQFANCLTNRVSFQELQPTTLNRLGSGQPTNALQASTLGQIDLGAWLEKWKTEGFSELHAQTLRALASNPNRLFSSPFMTAGLVDAWLQANAGPDAGALSPEVLNAWATQQPGLLSQSVQLDASMLGDWIIAQGPSTPSTPRGLAALSITALNELALAPGRPLRAENITAGVWSNWLSRNSNSLAGLSVQVINELAQSPGTPLSSAALSQARFGSWFGALNDAQLRQLSPLAFRALAANPNALLSSTALTQTRFNSLIEAGLRHLDANTLTALNANTNQLLRSAKLTAPFWSQWLQARPAEFSLLSVGVINSLGANASQPLGTTSLTPELWAAWLSARSSGTGSYRDLSASTLHTLALSGPSGALAGMGFNHWQTWLNASTGSAVQAKLNSLSAATVNALLSRGVAGMSATLRSWTSATNLRTWLNHRMAAGGEDIGAFSAATLTLVQGFPGFLTAQNWVTWGQGTAAGQSTRNHIGDLAPSVVAGLSATMFNDIVQQTPAGQAFVLVGLSREQWQAWLDGTNGAGFRNLSPRSLLGVCAAEGG